MPYELFKNYFERKKKKLKKKMKNIKAPKLKLNPNHPTGKAILQRRKRMKNILDKM